jgi:hypothetical protein
MICCGLRNSTLQIDVENRSDVARNEIFQARTQSVTCYTNTNHSRFAPAVTDRDCSPTNIRKCALHLQWVPPSIHDIPKGATVINQILTPGNSHPRTGPNTSFPIVDFRPTARRSAKQTLANLTIHCLVFRRLKRWVDLQVGFCTPTSKPISCQNSACTVYKYAYFILKGNTKWNKSVVNAQDFECLTGSSSSDNDRTEAATFKYEVLRGVTAKRVPESLKTWRWFEQKMSKKIITLIRTTYSRKEKTNPKSWFVIWRGYGYWRTSDTGEHIRIMWKRQRNEIKISDVTYSRKQKAAFPHNPNSVLCKEESLRKNKSDVAYNVLCD